MVNISPVEAVALHVAQCAFRRVTVRTLWWCALALALYWVILRLCGTVDPTETTLYNPIRLREALGQFVQQRTEGGGGERHRTEALCRRLLEFMLEMELPKCRPKWLVNPTTKRCLELDMYNATHQLAFEYDGAQHDVYTPHYHANEDHFAYRKLLDRLKTELCRDAGVKLVRISWAEVSQRDPVRTARFLERLLYTHGLPYRSALVSAGGQRDPSPSVGGSPFAERPHRTGSERPRPWR
jgi:hypothetical protein